MVTRTCMENLCILDTYRNLLLKVYLPAPYGWSNIFTDCMLMLFLAYEVHMPPDASNTTAGPWDGEAPAAKKKCFETI